MLQSPLFVCTDLESDSDGDEFDSDNYDNDNDSIDSDDISTAEIESPSSHERYPEIRISEGDDTPVFAVEKEDCPSSTDPFASNYRKKADWDPIVISRWEKEWSFVKDVVEKYESVEHAEFTRPFDQFRVLLQERDLYERYEELWRSKQDSMQRLCDVMNMLLEEAPELITRYAMLERTTRERIAAMERGERAAWEVAWEKKIKAELGPWGTPRIM